ncbi:MAG: Coenzyme F420 hydrogenase/dehydrogenase, beta subunit C-terminal domain [Lachnospiraceae bacterium]|nr:Coenzyme F420 hydrogenase/dehydrogenase, beta subunit C-terminal domain [Lachnospiraceae bacterium]
MLVENKEQCSACAACYNICPKNAVELASDEFGYVYPLINKDKCIGCNLCEKVCPFKNIVKKFCPIKTYAAVYNSPDIINSTSGGAFKFLADRILESGGSVYGASMEASMDGSFRVKHKRAISEEGLLCIRGSKYVQSDMDSIYQNVRDDLEEGKAVLFSGTPCQVAGMRSYFKDKYENLFLIDIICHGVPNLKLFNDYIRYYESKHNLKVVDFCFRDKKRGTRPLAKITFTKGKHKKQKYIPYDFSSYYMLFMKGYIYRESCYNCKFACPERVGDITIGDCWGLSVENAGLLKENGGPFVEKSGISCVLCNTPKGQNLFESCSNRAIFKEIPYEYILAHNGQLNHPSIKPDAYDELLNDYSLKGYDGVEMFYKNKFPNSMLYKAYWKEISMDLVRQIIPSKVRKMVKNLVIRKT